MHLARPLVLGVCGGIGAGKTLRCEHLTRMFAGRRLPLPAPNGGRSVRVTSTKYISADIEGHEVLRSAAVRISPITDYEHEVDAEHDTADELVKARGLIVTPPGERSSWIAHLVVDQNPNAVSQQDRDDAWMLLSGLDRYFGFNNVFHPAMGDGGGNGSSTREFEVNRKSLSALVFSDVTQLQTLNSLTWPLIARRVQRCIASITELPQQPAADDRGSGRDASADVSAPLVVLEAALLVEMRALLDLCDACLLVDTDEDTAVRRLRMRNGLEREEALRRVRAQCSMTARAEDLREYTNARPGGVVPPHAFVTTSDSVELSDALRSFELVAEEVIVKAFLARGV